MRSVPLRARVYVACVVAAALICLAPLPDIPVPWGVVALLAALYAAGERLRVGYRGPEGLGVFFPVLLAGAFLLPPPVAALLPLPGALFAPVEQRPRPLRRIWRAARLAAIDRPGRLAAKLNQRYSRDASPVKRAF